MGFFSYAYVIEGHQRAGGIDLSITAYSMDGPALFSWGRGSRSDGLESLADGTLFCAKHARPLPGYPRIDSRDDVNAEENGLFYIEESFFAPQRGEPVLFHVALPSQFVIRPDRTPFTLTKEANITAIEGRLVFTLPVVGGAI
jgi:hypothetical protein